MGVILLGCGLQMATTLAQHSPAALETMVGSACLQSQADAAKYAWVLSAEFCHYVAAAESIGVCAEPELAIKNLTPANPFFLIGSDGIFEFMPSQTVVDMVSLYSNLHSGKNWLLVKRHMTSSSLPQLGPLLQDAHCTRLKFQSVSI